MADYRDYGAIQGQSAPQVPVMIDTRTQVYKVTHDEAGNRLPHRDRSFISFTYGGVNIEDYDFISITENNAISHSNLYGSFNDIVSTYDIMDGQRHWDTHFQNNSLSLRLVTDGLTEQKLNELKVLFKPGIAKELVLAENHNRAIYARVSEVPEIQVVPFEKKTTISVAGTQYETSTTLYKGFLNVSFVMDDPFWFSISNVITSAEQLQDEDTVKVVLEDNIPYIGMIYEEGVNYSAFLGDGVYNNTEKLGDTITLRNSEPAYLYNAGNAPTNTILSFTHTPLFANENPAYEGAYFIKEPLNDIYKEKINPEVENTYNTISIGNDDFKFTTPSILTGYNQALSIFSNFSVGDSIIEIRAALRDGIKEYYSRAWAMGVITYMMSNALYTDQTTYNILSGAHIAFYRLMSYFFPEENNANYPITYTFDSKLGEATASTTINTIDVEAAQQAAQTVQEDRIITDMVGSITVYDAKDGEDAVTLIVKKPLTQNLNGYDKPWAAGKGKNLCSISDADLSQSVADGETITIFDVGTGDNLAVAKGVISFKCENVLFTTLNDSFIAINADGTTTAAAGVLIKEDGAQLSDINTPYTGYLYYSFTNQSVSVIRLILRRILSGTITELQFETGVDTRTAYAPYENICEIEHSSSVYATVNSNGTTSTISVGLADSSEFSAGNFSMITTNNNVATNIWKYITNYNPNSLNLTATQWISDRDEYVSGTNPTTGAAVAYLVTGNVNATPGSTVTLHNGDNIISSAANYLLTLRYKINNPDGSFISSAVTKEIIENVGDMVYDKYLILKEKNSPNSNGFITTNECTPISTDCEGNLTNFKIEYRYMYL